MRVRILLTVLLGFSMLTAPAVASNATKMLRNCINTPSAPCVEKILIRTNDGREIEGKLTGRSSGGEGIPGASQSDEYEFAGMEFENPAGNRMVNRVYFDGTWIQTVVEATWLNNSGNQFQLALPRRSTDLLCGTKEAPSYCQRNVKFNTTFQVEQDLRLPRAFVLAYLNGRTDSLRFTTGLSPRTIDGVDYITTRLIFNVTEKQQVLFSQLLPDPLASSDYADFTVDQTIVNLYTPANPNSQRLGKCSGIRSVSVVSNGINPEVPYWDSNNQSINVQVSGPHYKVNGELNKGYFEARISREIGKCLWGFDLSKATKAEISITNSDGSGIQSIETVLGSFDGTEYVLNHSNYHYSSPKISIKLLGEKEIEVAPFPKATVKKSTIICTKGKVNKKVTAVKPKCPAGFKKK